MGALGFVLLSFSCSFSCLKQEIKDFHGIDDGAMSLWQMFLGTFAGDQYKALHEVSVILVGCFAFLIMTTMFLFNMLVAQLSCAYDGIYADMVGYARLKRILIIKQSMPAVSAKKFNKFVQLLAFEKRLEFEEGDVGLPNGIQTYELANANPTTVDQIRRFGGSTSPSIQWPNDDMAGDDDSDKFERLEQLIKKALERIQRSGGTSSKSRGKSSGDGSKNDSDISGGSMSEEQ